MWLMLFHHDGLTQTFMGVVGADLHHGNIHRIISSLAICLQSQNTFVLLLHYIILSWITDVLVLKTCWLEFEYCLDTFKMKK